MPAIFFDTETTGKYNFRGDFEDADQPDLVQLAFMVDDDEGNNLACNYFPVIPNKDVEAGAEAVHGKSRQWLEKYGVSIGHATSIFQVFYGRCNVAVAHNIKFDLAIMKRAYFMAGKDFFDHADPHCTMLGSSNLCKLPGRGRSYKWPKLDEAYRLLVNKGGFEHAHDALADVKACREIYYATRSQT